jgi:shikimate dehydrogenase
MERLFGLIGYPLSHSFSAEYFAGKFRKENIQHTQYRNFPVHKIDELDNLIKHYPNLAGLNVTIPYKEQVISLLSELSPEAESIGAVNTIKIIRREGTVKTIGYNTDVTGFERTLDINHVSTPRKSLILGTGGASKAAAWVLQQKKSQISFATRNPVATDHISYDEISGTIINDFDLIVNTTPLGMYPDVESCPPIPYDELDGRQIFFDLVYNPVETMFLLHARRKNCRIINGLYMLEQQAEKAWEIWNEDNGL